MLKSFVLWAGLCFVLHLPVAAADYTDQEARAAWEHWKRQPITQSNFLAICDLMQDIGKTNIGISYEILAEYVPMVRKTGNRERLHILLMGWARAKEALLSFDDAENLYRQALANAAGDVRRYDEVMVGLSLMYAEWGKTDSLDKYDSLGKGSAARAGDKENLSFLYTFGAVGRWSNGAAGRGSSGPGGHASFDTAGFGPGPENGDAAGGGSGEQECAVHRAVQLRHDLQSK